MVIFAMLVYQYYRRISTIFFSWGIVDFYETIGDCA